MSHLLAADIGGTNLRLAIVQTNGKILKEFRHQADFSRLTHASPAAAENHILKTLASAMEPLLAKASISAIGIGFPGFFIGNSGVLASSPNLPQLQNFALTNELSQRFNIKVVAQNDALCAALGEARFGVGKHEKNLLHITLGTGIGAGLIMNQLPYAGEHGMAMEFGHLRVVHDEHARACGCGNAGCLEAYASATAIMAAYQQQTGSQSDCASIHQAALNGDTKARLIIEQAGGYLGSALAEASKLLDIKTVSISGGLTGAWDMLYPNLMAQLNQQLIPPLKKQIRVLQSTLHDRGGLLGAAALADIG